MPELPEVQTVVNTLTKRVIGREIRAVTLNRSDIITPQGFNLAAALRNRRVVSVSRRAKRIVFTLDDGNRFYIHLGMSGRLTVERITTPVPPHTHLILDIAGDEQIRFRDPRRFGGIWWLGREIDEGTLG